MSMIHKIISFIFLFLELFTYYATSQHLDQNSRSLSAKISKFLDNPVAGKKWALLVAGSRDYWNYRHQADVCHAYQILRRGGLEEENIIVFMYDDIAYNEHNPKPGVIVNSPNGGNVYEGVPKDYTGNYTTIHNLFAVILGNRSALTGGSGKVLDSGPNDHIFVFYADHGGPGVVEMPCNEYLYADDLIKVLTQKHKSNGYASMVFYLEACEAGSMFEGLLPETLNIYATTASNASESSLATYCPGDSSAYDVCLGDMYSISWMEDCEKTTFKDETLKRQFEVVKLRTAGENPEGPSHVMQYGNLKLNKKPLYSYMGNTHSNRTSTEQVHIPLHSVKSVDQREATLLHYKYKLIRAPTDSKMRIEAQKQLNDEINSRSLIDNNMNQISTFLYGAKNGIEIIDSVRGGGKPLVDDWTCLKTLVKTYEENCGALSKYGMKHIRTFSNMCNAGLKIEQMMMASARICKQK